MMGLRGLTVLIASGDDGIGNLGIRKNQPLACSQVRALSYSSLFVTIILISNRLYPISFLSNIV